MKRFGTMLDCSRNAVPTVESVQKWIDILSDLGYNTLLLYMEDTYEIEGEPYFGYKRGRYTEEELKAMDIYAKEQGVELIPCIQTLAHLQSIERWPEYWGHFDCADILCVGDERNYKLIEGMFATLARCFSTKTIHIGMDEAYLVGRGRYYEKFGEKDRSQVMIEHLQRICEIGKQYGFHFLIWSDMFFKEATGGNLGGAPATDDVLGKIPDNVELVYWEYYSKDEAEYDKKIKAHQRIKEGTWFAGGLMSWAGFAPHNQFSMMVNEVALTACEKNQVDNVFFTMWGDCGGECSRFALLPALFYAAEFRKGNRDIEVIKEKFFEKFGITFDDFLLLDLPETANDLPGEVSNAEKYMLYNDYLTGIMDTQVRIGDGKAFAQCATRLAKHTTHPQWGYLFETQRTLCEVLSVKAELSVRTRSAYQNKDKATISKLLIDYEEVAQKLQKFLKVYRKQWLRENKPHGFDIQDIRIGGLIARTESAKERLEAYVEGTILRIEELEEEQLSYFGIEPDTRRPLTWVASWSHIATTNIV